MAISRRIARPLLASIFIVGGIDAFRNPEGKVKKAEAVTGPLSERFSAIPSDPETLVQINGAVQVGAGVLLATGKFRRLASLVLIGSIIPTTYAGHRWWEETDEATRQQQKIQFAKNLGLLGGLILAAMDTEGQPSIGWRARHRAHQLEAAVALGRAASTAHAHTVAAKPGRARVAASATGKRAIRQGRSVGRIAARRAQGVATDAAIGSTAAASHLAQQAGATLSTAARQLEPLAHDVAKTGLDVVVPHLAQGVGATSQVLSNIGDHLPRTES
jgi:uncharacterized membrane protein YphA (DoxX/SURF4 family)